jgi:hypothetical protein
LLEREQGPNKRDFISGCGGPQQLVALPASLEVRLVA